MEEISTMVKSFYSTTIEFIWEENNPVTTEIFTQCIILKCMVITFQAFQLEEIFRNKTKSIREKSDERVRTRVYEHILRTGVGVGSQQKFSAQDFVLISDSTFPHKRRVNRALQTTDLRNNQPIKIPRAIVLATPSLWPAKLDPKLFAVVSLYSTALLVFISVDLKFIRIGCFSCKRKIRIYKTFRKMHNSYGITLVRVPQSFATSIPNLVLFWKQLHSNLYFGTKTKAHNCESIYLHKIKPSFSGDLCNALDAYFNYINCSNFNGCVKFYKNEIRIGRGSLGSPTYFSEAYPFGVKHFGYTFQVVLPKVHFSDAKDVTSFLTIWAQSGPK